MNYNEWLELLETLKKSSKIEYVEKFKNEPLNENLKEMLKPKIKEMIDQRFNRSIEKIVASLEEILIDENILDMELVNFRKSNKITLDMINNQYLNEEEQKSLYDSIYERVDKIFKILERETLANDDSGISYQIVKNNEIKRDDKYEL